MFNVINLRKHPVLDFASEELQAMARSNNSTDQFVVGTWEDCEQQVSLTTSFWSWQVADNLEYDNDAYCIVRHGEQLILTGKSERSTLYAVYQYGKEQWKLEWVYPGVTSPLSDTSRYSNENKVIYEPLFKRRGFVYEHLRDKEYLCAVVDWLAKNRQNELFLTFPLWHYLRDALQPELQKRGISLTLGGHSMKFFTERLHNLTLNNDGAAPALGHKQLDYSDLTWQEAVIEDIIAYCTDIPQLTRISLWPEDSAVMGEPEKKKRFMELYISFSERLQQALIQAGLSVVVEHIAYNAGLSWDMLEKHEHLKSSTEIDTLFAYWGRDYSQGWNQSQREEERKAYKALTNWTDSVQGNNRKLTIFEYYSDHYMLSYLFPSMSKRIYEDLVHYHSLGMDSIVNLVVPYPQAGEQYSWKWAQGANSYVFSRAAWGDSWDEIIEDYWNTFDEQVRQQYREGMTKIGELLAGLTSYNVPLFPSRVVDVPGADVSVKDEIISCLSDIHHYVKNRYPEVIREGDDPSPIQLFLKHIYRETERLGKSWEEKM